MVGTTRQHVVDIVLVVTIVATTAAANAAGNARSGKTVEIATSISGGVVKGEDGKPMQGEDGNPKQLPGRVVLLRYDGKGGYETVFEHEGLGGWHDIAAGDVTHDGIDDVVVSSEEATYLIRSEDGGFAAKRLDGDYGKGVCVATGDSDGDGRKEIYIRETDKVHCFHLDGIGEIERQYVLQPSGKVPPFQSDLIGFLAVGDVDGDGRDEIVSESARGLVMTVGENHGGTVKLQNFLATDLSAQLKELDAFLIENGQMDKITSLDVVEFKQRQRMMTNTMQKPVRERFGYDGEVEEIIVGGTKGAVAVGGKGSRDILVIGEYDKPRWEHGYGRTRHGSFQVLRYSNDGFKRLVMERLGGNHLETTGCFSCTLGDVNNDGKPEVVIGADRAYVFGYSDGPKMIWQSDKFRNRGVGVSSVSVADTDGDGRNELVATCKTTGEEQGESMIIWEYDGKGMRKEWQSPLFDGWMRTAIGNFDGK